MTVCHAKPEVDGRLTHPPNFEDIARFWAGVMDTTVLLTFNLWFAYVFNTNVMTATAEQV